MFWGAFVFAFIGMEFAAAAAHHWLMHGPLWTLHRDHHRPGAGFFQRNDWFFLFFATPSALSIAFGMNQNMASLTGFGFGILGYGVAYVVVHEILIHRRLRILPTARRGYLGAITRRHRLHHAKREREDGRYFGMLWAPPAEWR